MRISIKVDYIELGTEQSIQTQALTFESAMENLGRMERYISNKKETNV